MTDRPIPTLADVARHANVSTATVSRCLNSPERVEETTRDRVMTAVQDLGYSPNFVARALAAKRTNTVGAIIPTMENAIFARGIQAFQEELGRHGVTLLVASSSYRADLEEEQIRTLTARGADGLLLIGHERGDTIHRFLDQRGVPALVSWAYDPTAKHLSIGFDNQTAMTELADEVIALGHRQIAVISAEQRGNDRARARVAGILAAMQTAGLNPAELDVVETPYGIDTGAEAFAALMQRSPRPTVVMCGNDVLAAGALRQAKAMGLGVPDQVSITGFDDIELAGLVSPGLTTVHVPHRDMGRQAAQLLVGMIKGNTPAASIRLPTHLKWRESLAPPPR
jgi:LacI family transcriptional regulator